MILKYLSETLEVLVTITQTILVLLTMGLVFGFIIWCWSQAFAES